MAKRKEKKELTARVVLIDHVNGMERQRNWEDIPEGERERLAIILSDNAMAAAGYTRVQDIYSPL